MAEIESDISRMLNAPPDPSPAYVEAYDEPPVDDTYGQPPSDDVVELIRRLNDPWFGPHISSREERIQQNFIRAIFNKNTDDIQTLIDSGLVSINPEFGQLPLAVAVKTGQTMLVRLLITKYGAEVNRLSDEGSDNLERRILRTPLMLAAERGSLPVVKMLMEEFGADDAVIAPDGMNALRLAVLKGEDAAAVVEYLPVRRGGGWLRFKHDHFTAMRRIKRGTEGVVYIAKALFWHIPKFFLWSLPKWTLKKLGKAGKHFFTVTLPYSIQALGRGLQSGAIKLSNGFKFLVKTMWEFIKSIPERSVKLAVFLTKTTPIYIWNLCKTMAVKMTGWIKHLFTVAIPHALSVSWKACVSGSIALKDAIIAGAKALRNFFIVQIPRATVATSKALWRLFTVHIPKFVKGCAKLIWRIVKALAKWTKSLVMERIPALIKSFVKLIKTGSIKTWKFLVKGISLVFSSLHNLVAYIIKSLGQVSFKDVLRSIRQVFHWILIELPAMIWSGLVATGSWLVKAFEKMFGWVGKTIVLISQCLAWIVLYIPIKIVFLIGEFFKWIGRGMREVMVWINPKSGF